MLEQEHPEGWRPVAFWSRKLRDAETRYSATDLEWMAVVVAVTKVWYWMLEGRKFTVCSDHKALERKLMKGCQDPPLNDRQAKWIESMSRFSCDYQWTPGAVNTVADALSRYPICNTTAVVQTQLTGLTRRLQLASQHDPQYVELLAVARRGEVRLQI